MRVEVDVGVLVFDKVAVADAEGLGDGVCVAMLVDEDDGVAELVGVSVAVGVQVGRVVAVFDGVDVAVAVRLGVRVGVEVSGNVSVSANEPNDVV